MLSIPGPRKRYCDGISRRGFLKIGGFALGSAALSLPDILRAEQAAGGGTSHKAVINIFLAGGAPHQEMWEIKTEAPAEIRGEFRPIDTSVPGIRICELFPRLAGMMDKLAVIRSVVGSGGGHDSHECMSGWNEKSLESIGGRPSIGSAIAKVRGPVDRSVPATVGMFPKVRHRPWTDPGRPGFLGAAYQPFRPQGEVMANLTLNGVTADRLQDRERLLHGLDTLKRTVDASGQIRGMDAFTAAAFGVLTSSKLLDALDLSREDPQVRARYGDGKPYNKPGVWVPTNNENLLVARRLVEAGVRSVTLSYGTWDTHDHHFPRIRHNETALDQGLSALVWDLDQRGMLDDVTIVCWGEFGRTPRINSKPGGGRDHWPRVSCALLAGGGMQTGQAIGSTNRLGESALDRPVHLQEIVATIYHNLGIDPMTTTLIDPAGRPQYLVDHRVPMRELV